MKRIAVAVVCVGAFVAGASCTKGTLGTTGGNPTGPGPTLDGIGGATVTGQADAGPGGGSGGIITGDPGAGGNGFPGVGGGDAGGSSAGSGGGRPGRGGAGGSTGRGGTGYVFCPAAPLPACGFPACGNGVADTCQVASNPGCPPITQVEGCDGDDFRGLSCTTLGFGSGALTCSGDCTVDQSGCSDCAPIGGRLTSCGPAPIAFPSLLTFAMASTATEVGVGQIDLDSDTGGSRVTFARLDTKLGLIGVVGVEDTAQAGPLQYTLIDTIAVAPTSSGWLVAACGGGSVFVQALDATGQKIGRTVLSDRSDVSVGCTTGTLILAPQPAGGALLAWNTYYEPMAVLIGADGSAGEIHSLMDATVLGAVGPPTAAWLGDAYTIAVPFELAAPDYPYVLRLLRVATDGTMTKVADVLSGEFPSAPSFVTGADGIRLTYDGIIPGSPSQDLAVMERRIGPMGQLLTDPITLGLYPAWFGRAPAVAFGDDTVVLMSGVYQERFSVVRLDAAGTILSRSDVAIAPDYGVNGYDMVRLGGDVVVGWLRPGSPLTLARVSMP